MGRLTLNVLLSFAQFEREVTGERIREFYPIHGEVVSAAYDNARIPLAGGRSDPAKFEWPVLLRKIDRFDSSYKQ